MWIEAVFQVLLLCSCARANVEKIVFLGPKERPDLENFQGAAHLDGLLRLTPVSASVHCDLLARFPSTPSPRTSSEIWLLLDELYEGQRYEARVCWSATQPTAFDISVYDFEAISHDSVLNSSLFEHSRIQRSASQAVAELPKTEDLLPFSPPASIRYLFLHISAAADYYSTDAALMHNGLLVGIDIILDPYILNILPKSLGPTAGYLLLLVFISWVLSDAVWRWLSSVAHSDGAVTSDDPAANGPRNKKTE